MRPAHKALLAVGTAFVVALFWIASRPPDDGELEYVPPKPPAEITPGASAPAAPDETAGAKGR